jgi:hypothetical protein
MGKRGKGEKGGGRLLCWHQCSLLEVASVWFPHLTALPRRDGGTRQDGLCCAVVAVVAAWNRGIVVSTGVHSTCTTVELILLQYHRPYTVLIVVKTPSALPPLKPTSCGATPQPELGQRAAAGPGKVTGCRLRMSRVEVESERDQRSVQMGLFIWDSLYTREGASCSFVTTTTTPPALGPTDSAFNRS